MPDIDLPACQTEFEAASRKPQLAEAWFYDWGQRLLDQVEELQSQRDEALSWIKTVTDRLEPNDSSILAATVSAANRWLDELVAKASGAAMSDEAAPAPSPPKIVLPEPDSDGDYRFPDGSRVFLMNEKWEAQRKRGDETSICDPPYSVKGFWYPAKFNTPLEAARALQELGEGPGRHPMPAETEWITPKLVNLPKDRQRVEFEYDAHIFKGEFIGGRFLADSEDGEVRQRFAPTDVCWRPLPDPPKPKLPDFVEAALTEGSKWGLTVPFRSKLASCFAWPHDPPQVGDRKLMVVEHRGKTPPLPILEYDDE